MRLDFFEIVAQGVIQKEGWDLYYDFLPKPFRSKSQIIDQKQEFHDVLTITFINVNGSLLYCTTMCHTTKGNARIDFRGLPLTVKGLGAKTSIFLWCRDMNLTISEFTLFKLHYKAPCHYKIAGINF